MITFNARTPGVKLAVPVTLVNVLVASGFSLAGLLAPKAILPPGSAVNDASHTFALYAAARTIPLALFVIASVLKRSWSGIVLFGLLAGFIQLCDALIGVLAQDPGKTLGPLVLGVVQIYAILFMIKNHGLEPNP